ncbi:hypothetical protein BQ1740_2916 [Bacillus subtilis]|nr:hypothetical protein BQ1740_2916 [Bacillus subtilis]
MMPDMRSKFTLKADISRRTAEGAVSLLNDDTLENRQF